MVRFMLCAVVSWLVLGTPVSARADDEEDKAVKFVEKLGGSVARDAKQPGRPVVRVSFTGKATDKDLKELVAFKNLTQLNLYLAPVTTRA